MTPFPVRDLTALNITNAVLGLAVLTIWIVVAVQALRELRLAWRHHLASKPPAAVHGKRG
jgi:hypothetical protein